MSTGETTYPLSQGELAHFSRLAAEVGTHTVVRHARDAAREGLSATERQALELVGQTADSLTPGRIGALTGLSTGAVTGVLDRLEKAGLVRRERDRIDRRKVLVAVTEAGRERLAGIARSAAGDLARVLAEFSPAERNVLERYQNAMLEALRENAHPA
ncbi:MarR family winged helix-turn-helix transcriptional regulator [Amycolatopsis jejuensis]|uniref:MarR family winged helix-turn-helix transcriptional regulator n=1 Tax=Amycolatopsis jejuensis TaxID=330084 RepID=UPI00052543C4|nr:MarR family transcriptional regulator [Amycolatopsis jejuensis]